MSYGSGLFIINQDIINLLGKEVAMIEGIASYNLCCVGKDEFKQLFTTPVDSNFSWDGERITEDRYGDPLYMAKPSKVADFLEKLEEENHRKEYLPIIAMLRAFNPEEWDDLEVIHYKY